MHVYVRVTEGSVNSDPGPVYAVPVDATLIDAKPAPSSLGPTP